MKSVDVDARHLIRTYIEGIEEYLRGHTRLHPNEIDSLLNEINDFVYLRSGELASGDRVHYNDVLKAIEECGSPSEICEQYLELDREEQPAPFTPKVTPSSSKLSTISQKQEAKPSRTQKVFISDREKMQEGFQEVASYYRRSSRWFSLYRFLFIFFIVLFDLTLLAAGYSRIPEWYFGSYEYYNESMNFCSIITFWAVILVVWEGIIINRWKIKLSREKGMDRSVDDTVVVWVSRLSFLLLFFLSSIILHFSYLFFVPIWLFLACFIERQLKSELWVENLGPWLVSLGSFLANPQEGNIRDLVPSFWTEFMNNTTNQEKGIVAILMGMLGVTFVVPWNTAAFGGGAHLFTFLSLTIIIGTLAILRYSRKKSSFKDPNSDIVEFELVAWLVRLLALKTILILGYVIRFDPTSFFLGSFIIIGILITSEILLNTYGGKSFRLWLSKKLISFGNPNSANHKGSVQPTSSDYAQEYSIIPKTEISFVNTGTTVSPSQKSPHQQEILESTLQFEKIESQIMRKPTLESRFLGGIGVIMKALITTVLMLLISFYEIILAFLVIMTSSSYNGVYEVPSFQFEGYWAYFLFSDSPIYTRGWILSMWHTLLLIGIQLFLIVTIQWYGLATRKPEGIILKVYRNLTRILLGIVIIGILSHMMYEVVYTQLQLFIAFGFVFFSEITAWKARSERKKLFSVNSKQKLPTLDNNNSTSDCIETTKAS